MKAFKITVFATLCLVCCMLHGDISQQRPIRVAGSDLLQIDASVCSQPVRVHFEGSLHAIDELIADRIDFGVVYSENTQFLEKNFTHFEKIAQQVGYIVVPDYFKIDRLTIDQLRNIFGLVGMQSLSNIEAAQNQLALNNRGVFEVLVDNSHQFIYREKFKKDFLPKETLGVHVKYVTQDADIEKFIGLCSSIENALNVVNIDFI